MKPKVLERDVLKPVWELLQTKYRHGHWSRVSAPLRLYKGIKVKSPNRGMGDIIGCLRGQYIEIETKWEGADRSHKDTKAAQAARRESVTKPGSDGLYIIARSPDDVDKVLREIDL